MADDKAAVLGVIGGSGVYDIDGLENTRWVKVEPPFGDPSDELLTGELHGQSWFFCRAMAGATGFRRRS